MNIHTPFIHPSDSEKYILATYFLESGTDLAQAAWELAIGQSVGNPLIRSKWESDELFQTHSVRILAEVDQLLHKKSGEVTFAFPVENIDFKTDGISQLLCQLMGGQMDIDNIRKCHLIDLKIPNSIRLKYFKKPMYGLSLTRELSGAYNKPLLGGIIKPKIINNIDILVRMVNEMVDGGINFIKEDEIMSNPSVCPLELRVKTISRIIEQTNVIYTYCINSDYPIERAKQVYDLGGRGIHINIWSGLGTYRAIRELDLPLFIHFQKSGDKVLTHETHRYHIEWNVICYLAALSGVDSIHIGMVDGYSSSPTNQLNQIITMLRYNNVIPTLSCGMHPGLINYINNQIGVDYMANVGGALHGHPDGTIAGVKAMRQAIDKHYESEYNTAVQLWGVRE